MHQRFWGDEEIQEFWSGKSFLRPDDGNMLSYDLARILVSTLATDWDAFASFVRAADVTDAGASAASEHLHVELGVLVSTLLEKEAGTRFAPSPEVWQDQPERGAFRKNTG